MLTKLPISGWNGTPPVCSADRIQSEELMRPLLLPGPVGDAELEELVLAQCFSLARSRARELRQDRPQIVSSGAECEAGEAALFATLEPELM